MKITRSISTIQPQRTTNTGITRHVAGSNRNTAAFPADYVLLKYKFGSPFETGKITEFNNGEGIKKNYEDPSSASKNLGATYFNYQCKECNKGYYLDEVQSNDIDDCKKCPRGKYADQEGASAYTYEKGEQ